MPVTGYEGPCDYCMACIAHLRESRVVNELRLVGIDSLLPMEPHPATHFAYPFKGAQAGNAATACDRHAELLRLDDGVKAGRA